MLKHRIVTLNGTAQDLVIHEPVDALAVFSVQNIMSVGFAYLGNKDVTSLSYGHKLYPGQSFTVELAPNDKLYAVGDSGVKVALFSLDI